MSRRQEYQDIENVPAERPTVSVEQEADPSDVPERNSEEGKQEDSKQGDEGEESHKKRRTNSWGFMSSIRYLIPGGGSKEATSAPASGAEAESAAESEVVAVERKEGKEDGQEKKRRSSATISVTNSKLKRASSQLEKVSPQSAKDDKKRIEKGSSSSWFAFWQWEDREPAPENVVLKAATDTTLHIHWDMPLSALPSAEAKSSALKEILDGNDDPLDMSPRPMEHHSPWGDANANANPNAEQDQKASPEKRNERHSPRPPTPRPWEFKVQHRAKGDYLWSSVITGTYQIQLAGLKPGTEYSIRLCARKSCPPRTSELSAHATSSTRTSTVSPSERDEDTKNGAAVPDSSSPKPKPKVKKKPETTGDAKGRDSSTKPGNWGLMSDVVVFQTRGRLQQEATDAKARVDAYFAGRMKPYPEDSYQDTSYDKAGRVGLGIMHTLDFVGFGGAYVKTAKFLWRARHGLGALLLAQDVEEAVTNLSRLLNEAREQLKFSVQDAIFGSYYIMALRRGERRRNPDFRHEEHKSGLPGILAEDCPDEFFDSLESRMALAWLSYAPTRSSIQWVCRRHPKPGDPFEVILSSPSSVRVAKALVKPAYALLAHRRSKRVVLSIRGTNSFEDVIVDASHKPAPFPSVGDEESWGFCHEGMLRASQWLLRDSDGIGGFWGKQAGGAGGGCGGAKREDRSESQGQQGDTKEGKQGPDEEIVEMEGGGGIGVILERFYDQGYKIEIVGHSLGGGVGTLVALLLSLKRPNMTIDVYAFAPPACVCEKLVNRCDRRQGGGVRVRSMVLEDDAVPRASTRNILLLAREIVDRQGEWKPMMRREIEDYQTRAMGLWAPMHRTTHWSRIGRVGTSHPEAYYLVNSGEGGSKRELKEDEIYLEGQGANLVPPGVICHVYSHNGQRRASLVDHSWIGLRRVEVSRHTFADHSRDAILSAMRDAAAVRKAAKAAPTWGKAPPFGPILCCVCGYSVAWASSSDNPLEQYREMRHCYACGRIVCAGCSSSRITLPEFGILSPVRVCEHCYLCGGPSGTSGSPATPK